jgi:hypothetical protein
MAARLTHPHVLPVFDSGYGPLRKDPRYGELVKKIGLR